MSSDMRSVPDLKIGNHIPVIA